MRGFRQPIPLPRPPASVWATGQLDVRTQLARGGYLPDTVRDETGIPPAVAAHAIALYTRPGDTVLDPQCGAGTVLVEALRAGRHAIGITDQRRWWPVARANVTVAKRDGAPTDGMVLDGPPGPATGQLAGLAGSVDLVLTALSSQCPKNRKAAGQETDQDFVERSVACLQTTLTQCLPLLRPGGYLIVVVRPRRHCGYLANVTGEVLAAGRGAGLIPVERCIALLAELHGDRITLNASLAQRRSAAGHQRATGHLIALTAHHEVLIFRTQHVTLHAADLSVPHAPCRTQLGLVAGNEGLALEKYAA